MSSVKAVPRPVWLYGACFTFLMTSGRLHLGALLLGVVVVPFEEAHLAQCEIRLDPCVERFALTVLNHAFDVERLDVRTLDFVIKIAIVKYDFYRKIAIAKNNEYIGKKD